MSDHDFELDGRVVARGCRLSEVAPELRPLLRPIDGTWPGGPPSGCGVPAVPVERLVHLAGGPLAMVMLPKLGAKLLNQCHVPVLPPSLYEDRAAGLHDHRSAALDAHQSAPPRSPGARGWLASGTVSGSRRRAQLCGASCATTSTARPTADGVARPGWSVAVAVLAQHCWERGTRRGTGVTPWPMSAAVSCRSVAR